MDALEFLRERRRMCKSYKNCDGCPFVKRLCAIRDITSNEERKSVIAIVEQWSKEHPCKTRQSVFLRVIPNLRLDKAGSIQLCPATITGERCEVYGAAYENCYDCRKNFWGQEVE